MINKLIPMLAMLVIDNGALLAQGHRPSGEFVLNLDYARFRYDQQAGYLEIYYAFYPHQITYNSGGAGLQGGVRMHTRLTNQATTTVAFDRQVVLPVTITDTSSASYRHPFTTQTGHALPFGTYTIEVVAADSLNPSRRDSARLSVDIQPFAATVSLSDLELSSRVQPSTKTDDPFYKNSLEVVPNATLVFGIATHPVMFNYAELYGLHPDGAYTLKSQIVSSDGATMKETSKPRKFGSQSGVEASMMNVSAIMPGRYTYRLTVLDDKAVEVARSEKTFYVYNPHLKPPSPEATLSTSQLASLTTEELDADFRRAKYMATKEEIGFYAQLDSEVGKREFLERFWRSIEVGRGDFPPIKRGEYLRRAEAASRSYSVLNKDGWLSDRGRVYVLYGEPDHIERVQNESSTKPYQIWHYYNLERGVTFVFVDRLGNGDFQLMHSTKRGELQDQNWEFYLK